MEKYIIILTCFDYEVKNSPYLDVYDKLFYDKSEALSMAEKLSTEEAEYLNEDSERSFLSDMDGSEQFDFVTTCWDGDDYRIVTGYNIYKCEQ